MFNLPQLEEAVRTCYPTSISSTTQSKRRANIDSLWTLIDNAKTENNLQYGIKEERMELFHTSAGEIISIQYPGKESIAPGEKNRPYDFRPKIQKSDGEVLRDFIFKDMWSLVEHLNNSHQNMLKVLAALFFQLGRMTIHHPTTETYHCVILDNNGREISSTERGLTWNRLSISDDIKESLNFFIPSVDVDESTSISFEAFLYFFDLILQNEDSKYYYKKRNLTSGRIQTSDSMLLLVSHFRRYTPLSTLLQRYVSGFGVGKCLASEIEPATDGLVKLVDRKEQLKKQLDNANIEYAINRPVTINGEKIQVSLKSKTPKIAILNDDDAGKKAKLESKAWTVFDFESAVDSDYYQLIVDAYNL